MNANTQITKNFKFSEFFCQGQIPPEQYWQNIINVAIELQELRDIVGRPITITSGYRTKEHNAAIGGAVRSQHLLGKAVDIEVRGMHSKEVAIYVARYTNFMGIGMSLNINSITHVDTRDKFTLWYY
jgi:uncharacterized protein YcbK (DUF882 family)